jgi:hypothetical protein
MLIVNLQLIGIGIAAFVALISFGAFIFSMFKWAIKEIKDFRTDIQDSIVHFKQEMLTLRTNDLHHIYSELQDIRKQTPNVKVG